MKLNNLTQPQVATNLWFLVVTILTLGVVVPTNTVASYFLSTYAISIMLLFLVAGFIGLIFRNNLMIFSNFLACIVLCAFIKGALTQEFTYSIPIDDVEIRIAHLVLEDEQTIADFSQAFKSLDANFLSIQTPIEPTLEQKLTKQLSTKMPYWKKTICDNNLALFVFSKYELRDLDTLHYVGNNTVSLVGSMFIDSMHKEISFLSTRVPVDEGIWKETEKHLAKLSTYINTNCQDKPFLTLSGTRLASWTPEVQEFKTTHRLNDSEIDLGLVPRDEHIFYSKDLVCTSFDEIFDGNGVVATYQFKKEDETTVQHTYSAASTIKGARL